MFQENSIETCILSRVKQITSPGWMHETSARTWCTRKTQRDWVEREVGGGIGIGNTCKQNKQTNKQTIQSVLGFWDDHLSRNSRKSASRLEISQELFPGYYYPFLEGSYIFWFNGLGPTGYRYFSSDVHLKNTREKMLSPLYRPYNTYHKIFSVIVCQATCRLSFSENKSFLLMTIKWHSGKGSVFPWALTPQVRTHPVPPGKSQYHR